jgi:hypothetical protein
MNTDECGKEIMMWETSGRGVDWSLRTKADIIVKLKSKGVLSPKFDLMAGDIQYEIRPRRSPLGYDIFESSDLEKSVGWFNMPSYTTDIVIGCAYKMEIEKGCGDFRYEGRTLARTTYRRGAMSASKATFQCIDAQEGDPSLWLIAGISLLIMIQNSGMGAI